MIYTLHFHPDSTPQSLFEEHRRWNEAHARPPAHLIRPHDSERSARRRRLRVGYVSPDLRLHPVGRFFLPLLAHHDHEQFEVFCYDCRGQGDAFTEKLRSHADAWRDVRGLSDGQLDELIRQDGIDILVDLAMHLDANRLLVFARKPAPVQVTYLAYCSTTGLDAIDYRLTDPYLDPPGPDDNCYSEQSIRLPETYWCYEPGIATPDVTPPAGVEQRTYHLRMPEQLLQGDAAHARSVAGTDGGDTGFAADPALSGRRSPSATGGVFRCPGRRAPASDVRRRRGAGSVFCALSVDRHRVGPVSARGRDDDLRCDVDGVSR